MPYRFAGFTLDPADRQLRRGAEPVELNARYLDALVLLVREQGRLVSKDRFMDEVWRGVPVTDEALTQCIRTLRRTLGDDAAAPRFIETVPKHGYRFVAAVEEGAAPQTASEPAPAASAGAARPGAIAAGIAGGGAAGVAGGLFYGFIAASEPLAPGTGTLSVLLVLMCATVAVALLGAAGVVLGVALAGRLSGHPWRWAPAGGAAGGLAVGAFVKLLGLDAFELLLGRSPGDITGAAEGLVLGGAVGIGAWLSWRYGQGSIRRAVVLAATVGGLAGAAIPLLGGQLMAGSLDLLGRSMPGSRLRLDQLGTMFGEPGFGALSRLFTGTLEGALFAACVVGAMVLAGRPAGGVDRRP